jgi:hypothetical protein
MRIPFFQTNHGDEPLRIPLPEMGGRGEPVGKHGFTGPNGRREYMWVVVNTWTDDCLRGQLANVPQVCRHLRAGQTVEIREAEVFDWAIFDQGGMIDGGFTIPVSEREHQERG